MDESLSGRKEIAAAVARQSLLITALQYVNNPLAHGAQSGLHNKMKSLEHAKGPSWISQSGIDINLGGSGDQRHSINNRLSFNEIQELSDNDTIEVVCGAKGVGISGRWDSSVARMSLPLNFPVSTFSSPVEKMIKRTRSQANEMMLNNTID
jgi:hypothetical protein